MIVTEDFVYLHLGKTGGTFVEQMIARLISKDYGTYYDTSDPDDRAFFGSRDQHETIALVPETFRDRPILFTTCDPFTHYVSIYRFGFWKQPGVDLDDERTRERFPRYPDLTFEEYVRAINDWSLRVPWHSDSWQPALLERQEIGYLTWLYVQMLFLDPLQVVRDLTSYVRRGRRCEDLESVHFIRMENLNRELADFLMGLGYAEDRVEYIVRARPVPSPGTDESHGQGCEFEYTPAVKRFIREKERFVFALLGDPARGVPKQAHRHPRA